MLDSYYEQIVDLGYMWTSQQTTSWHLHKKKKKTKRQSCLHWYTTIDKMNDFWYGLWHNYHNREYLFILWWMVMAWSITRLSLIFTERILWLMIVHVTPWLSFSFSERINIVTVLSHEITYTDSQASSLTGLWFPLTDFYQLHKRDSLLV